MRQRTALRAIGVLAASAVVIGLGSLAPTLAQEPDPAPPPEPAFTEPERSAAEVAADQAALLASAEDLTGDITFSVPSGTFQGQLSVTMGTDVAGAEIRYTTDGQLPTAGSPVYDGAPLQFTGTTQLRAQPYTGGAPAGAVGTAVYVAQAVTTQHDLPVLVIDSYGRGRPDRQYFDGATMLFDPAGGTTSLSGEPAFATRAGFRLRGQSSATFDKTPYRIEFWDNDDDDAAYPVLGMPADSDWVLRGPFPDKALIREAFVYQLGRDLGLYAPRFEFVEFYLNPGSGPVSNDHYLGVYMIVETIKNRSHRLDLRRLRGDRPEDRVLPRLTGAYIWKFDWLAAEEPILPCTGPAATCWNFLELVDPHPVNHLQPEQREWITNHLNEFQVMLDSPGFADPETGYRAWIDVRSFVDHMIVNELSRELDAYVRSAYFYKDRGEPITAGPLWDYDLSFGVGGYFENDQIAGWQHQQMREPISNNWFQRLLQDPAFVEDVRGRWQELRSGPMSDAALTARVRALADPLANGAQRNFQRWPNLSSPMVSFFFTPTAPTWQGQVDFMLDWMLRRAGWLDSPAGWDVNRPANPPTTTPPTTTPPATTPPVTTGPPPTTSTPPTSGCTATYTVVNQWNGGFQGEVVVTAGSAPISGWTVTWTYANGQAITQAWGASVTTGPAVSATNESWNGTLTAGASTTFGFLGTWNGVNPAPTLTCAATSPPT